MQQYLNVAWHDIEDCEVNHVLFGHCGVLCYLKQLTMISLPLACGDQVISV